MLAVYLNDLVVSRFILYNLALYLAIISIRGY